MGGQSIIQAARLTAPKEMNGLPPKPHPIRNYHGIARSGSCKQDTRSRFSPRVSANCFGGKETGEFQEKRLAHREEAESFYRALAGRKVRVGARWFERLLAELNIELWIGDAAVIRTNRVRKQKTDRQDAHN